MISFLVTYYNQEKYVSRSLNSIFNQNMVSDFEVLVGDDGSSDRTVDIVKGFQVKYPNKIRLFIQERDNNKKELHVVRASLNRLNILSRASGDYICFLDGDDEYCDFDFAQKAVDELDHNPQIIGVAHNHVIIKRNGEKVFQESITEKTIITLNDYAKNMYIPAGTIVFRRPKNEDLNIVTKLKSFDDNDITYFFLNKGNFLYRNTDIYNYFSNDDGFCFSVDSLEMKLLNAADYETIQKSISKCHLTLFLRYWNTLLFVYENRNKLRDEKYQKYLSFCIKNGFVYKVLLWEQLGTVTKFRFILSVFLKKQFVRIVRKLKM